MTITEIALAGVIICLAGVGQSAIGFGYALFATSPLVWIGLPLPQVIAIVSTCSLVQAAFGVRHLRAETPWRQVWTTTAIRLASMIGGVILLKQLVTLDVDKIKLTVGGILCVMVAAQLLCRPRPVPKLAWGWGALAFVSSGVVAGICGMGGPPLVIWSMAHDWSALKTRAFLFAVFATAIPVQLVILALAFGTQILWAVAIGLAFLPLVWLGTLVGLPIGNRLPKETLRNIAYAILLVIGLSTVLPAVVAAVRH